MQKMEQSGKITLCRLLSPFTSMLSFALAVTKSATGPWPPPASGTNWATGGPSSPTWLTQLGTVHGEVGAEGAGRHAAARPALPPNHAGAPGELSSKMLSVSTCRLCVQRQRPGKVFHFSVSPNCQKLVFSPTMGKNPYNTVICPCGAFLI